MDPSLLVLMLFVWYIFLIFVMWKRFIAWYWGVLILAVGIAAMCAATYDEYMQMVSSGPSALMSALALYVMGCILAATVKETGIAESIVKRAIELGGSRPYIVILLIYFVWTYLSVAMPGPVGVILVGTITLPVMMAMGVEPLYAAIYHGWGWTTAASLWPVYWPFYQALTGVYAGDHRDFLYVITAIAMIVSLVHITYTFRKQGLPFRWGAPTEPPEEKPKKMMPAFTFVLPAIPVILILVFNIDAMISFIVGTLVTLAVALPFTGFIKKVGDVGAITERIFYMGGVNAVGLLLVFFVLGWIYTAGKLASVAAVFNVGLAPLGSALSGPLAPIVFILLTAVLAPLGIFRGPGNPLAMGALIFPAIVALNAVSPVAVWAMLTCTTLPIYIAGPTVAYVVWSAEMVGVTSMDMMKKALLPASIISAVAGVAAALMYVM